MSRACEKLHPHAPDDCPVCAGVPVDLRRRPLKCKPKCVHLDTVVEYACPRGDPTKHRYVCLKYDEGVTRFWVCERCLSYERANG